MVGESLSFREQTHVSAAMPLPMTRTMIVGNFVLFQLTWITCVEAGAHGMPWLGILAVVFSTGIHVISSESRARALRLTLFCTAIGVVVETILAAFHATQFNSPALMIIAAPLWMIALWALFSTTLNVSLRWLRGRYLLAAAFGAVGALSYLAGAKIGALVLPMNYSLLAVGVCWALTMPLLLVMAKRWDAFA